MARRSSTIKVSILGDARDLQRAFGQATTASRSFQDRIKNDFSILGSMAKTGVLAIGGIATAIAGLTLKGGISRALNIEDARAKLRGLGHDAETVEAIMENALAAVKGPLRAGEAARSPLPPSPPASSRGRSWREP